MSARSVIAGRWTRGTASNAYLAAVGVAGAIVLVAALAPLRPSTFAQMGITYVAVAALVLFAEIRPLITADAFDTENGVEIATLFVFALLILWGLGPALALHAVGMLIGFGFARRRGWVRTTVNIAVGALALGAAAIVLSRFGIAPTPDEPGHVDAAALPAYLLAGAAYFAVNVVVVSHAIALRGGHSTWREITASLRYDAMTLGTLLASAPLVAVVLERSAALLPLLVLPLLAVYATARLSVEKEHQSLHDSLTGLGNRKLLLERTAAALDEPDPDESGVAVVLLDLNRFKEVNDTLGHYAGDALLCEVARRLSAAVRPGDLVTRLGGDEFAVLVTGLGGAAQVDALAERLLIALSRPFVVEGVSFEVGASLGIAIAPEHGDTVDVLVRRADVAMYLAKQGGVGWERYDPGRDTNSTARLALLGELRHAIEADDGELFLAYQPQLDVQTLEVVGVEALARWRHRTRGIVGPDDFIPMAEASGLMPALTAWVLDEALAEQRRLRDRGVDLLMAVNVSVRDLHQSSFVERVAAALARHRTSPDSLQLEITESVLMTDPTRALATCRSLAALGVRLSLDDFGAGYSSLGQLHRLPVRELKIDRGFVVGRPDDEAAAIIRTVIELGVALGLSVLAEGVEDDATLGLLRRLGCHKAQGYHLGRPMPAAQLARWLAPDPAPAGGPARIVGP